MKKLIKYLLNTIPRPWLIRFSYIFQAFSRIYYKGKKYHCPVCKGNYRKFLPYGYVNVRGNAMCPGCLSLERHRIMWLFLNEKTDFFTSQKKVLHIAPEQCFVKRFRKQKNLAYFTADLESPLADYKCDVQEMPFEDNSYDVIICNHVLEHVRDDKKALEEILRILKPGGFSIMQVPANFKLEKTLEDNTITDRQKRTEIFGQYDHVRVYGQDYPEIVKSAGFIIDEKNFTELLSKEDKDKYSLYIDEFMYAYKKPK
ncbi:MAG: class I SAM-dependent methyltransferase [Bacteroidales bacterium]|nr:class I SAM-dependent methyltransferase [Bacteroidales bacterium]MBN2820111.1 class I SAM-dependent methyltransferase [Bacteroidales bacterium]